MWGLFQINQLHKHTSEVSRDSEDGLEIRWLWTNTVTFTHCVFKNCPCLLGMNTEGLQSETTIWICFKILQKGGGGSVCVDDRRWNKMHKMFIILNLGGEYLRALYSNLSTYVVSFNFFSYYNMFKGVNVSTLQLIVYSHNTLTDISITIWGNRLELKSWFACKF